MIEKKVPRTDRMFETKVTVQTPVEKDCEQKNVLVIILLERNSLKIKIK